MVGSVTQSPFALLNLQQALLSPVSQQSAQQSASTAASAGQSTSSSSSSGAPQALVTSTNPLSSSTPQQSSTGASILTNTPVTATGSALLGTAGGATTTLLGASDDDDSTSLFGALGSTQSNLLTQIEATANARLQASLATVTDLAKEQQSAINLQIDRWVSVKAQVNNAQIAVSNGQDAAKKANDTLLDLRTTLAAAIDPTQDKEYNTEQFDQQVNEINISADSAGVASNLVGNVSPIDYSPNQIQYRNDINGSTSTLTGTYLGSAFRIIGNDGTVWVPDLSSDTLQAYTALGGTAEKYKTTDGQTVAKATSTRNGLKLISYDPKTQNITVNVSVVPTDPPITVTGKLQTAGLGMMESWFYNDFATKADQTRAYQDITNAQVNVVSSQATLQMAATKTGNDQKHIDAALTALNVQNDAVSATEQKQTQDLQVKAAQQYLAMQANLQNLQSVQSNYLAAFSGFIDDPFAQAALDVQA